MRSLPPTFRAALPLSGVLFLLATNACVIINADGDDGSESCVELDEVCPNLVCEAGHVVVDGCEICECAPATCEPGPAPDCVNAVFIEADCAWTCGTGTCFSDIDCGPGAVCVLPGAERPEGDPPEGGAAPEPAPAPEGTCVVVETVCFSDADCGGRFFCDFNADGGANGGDGGAAPPPPDGDRADPIPPQEQGFCRPRIVECFADSDCPAGEICQLPGGTADLVAPSGECVIPRPVSECESDAQCAAGETCVVDCVQDPNCPECDACFFVGTCVAPEVFCGSDAECAVDQFCDFSGAAERPACIDENGDNVCDDIVPQLGVCRPLEQTGACAAALCAPGTTCVETFTGEAVCLADEDRCESELDCAADETCNAGTEICLPPIGCDPATGEACLAVCSGFCVAAPVSCSSDVDCAEGEVCTFDAAIDGGARPIIAPQGTCQPAPPTCSADIECGRGETCVNGICEAPAPTGCETIRCVAGTSCVEDATGAGSCVADIGECASSEECPQGSTCNAGDVCNAPPDCVRGEACVDLCYGYCVATPTP